MLTLDWFWFWQKPTVDFVTPLSLEQCQSRLTRALHFKRRLFEIQTPNPAIGKVHGTKFYVANIPNWWHRDDFRPRLYGRLSPTEQGTRVQAAFRPPAFTVLLFLLVEGVFLGLGVRDAFLTPEPLSALLSALMNSLGVLALGLIFTWVSAGINQAQQEFLSHYLHQTLQSKPSQLTFSKTKKGKRKTTT